MPKMNAAETGSHYVWLAHRVRQLCSGEGEAGLAADIMHRIVWRSVPRRFFYTVEQFDRDTSQQQLSRWIELADGKAREGGSNAELLEEMEATLRREGEAASQLMAGLARLEVDLEQTVVRLEAAEQESDAKSAQIAHLEKLVEQFKAKLRSPEIGDDVRAALQASFAETPSLYQSLLALEAVFPTRIRVLPSAYQSAKSASGFRRRADALRLLAKLPTTYWDLIQQGGHEAVAGAIGSSYAPTESESVRKNSVARKQRTFEYNGKSVEMLSHLKIGNKPSDYETLRVHFVWDDAEKIVIVGHCGRHLDFG